MSMLPELVKSLGTEGVLIALTLILAGGGVVTYFFWKFTSEILRMYKDLSQQALRDQRTDATRLAKEIRQSYEAGYQSGRGEVDECRKTERSTHPSGRGHNQ